LRDITSDAGMLSGAVVYAVTNNTDAPCTLPARPRIVSELASGGSAALPLDQAPEDAQGQPIEVPEAPLVVPPHTAVGLGQLAHSGAAVDGYSCKARDGWTGVALAHGTALHLWPSAACAQDSLWLSPFFDLRAMPAWAVRAELPAVPVDAGAAGIGPIGSRAAYSGPFSGGRADLDGDGRDDDVVVTSDGAMTVTLATGESSAVTLPTVGGPGQLSALPDLFGDGRHEALLATDAGCCFTRHLAFVYEWRDGGLEPISFPGRYDDGALRFDEYDGVQCAGDTVTLVAGSGGDHPLITRTSYRLVGSTLVPAGRTQTVFDGNGDTDVEKMRDVVHTRCPGMDDWGWGR